MFKKKVNHTAIQAFTLMEIIVVVVIVTIITAFGIPNYIKAVNKADERTVITNLMTLKSAVEIYTSEGDALGPWNSLSEINTELGLGLLDTTATYSCGAGGLTSECRATHPSGWTIHFHDEHSSAHLHCGAGTCPSCPSDPGNCG